MEGENVVCYKSVKMDIFMQFPLCTLALNKSTTHS